jgi:hypothetical protein
VIISHKYKFIFLKTNKTAGTSIEIALSKVCGPDDVITPFGAASEKLRTELGVRGPQNFLLEPQRNGSGQSVQQQARQAGFYNHIAAREVVKHITAATWDSYFKFCFERNPWDRAISLYYWTTRKRPRPEISAFIHSDELLRLKRRGFDVYTLNGDVAVDRLCRFEELAGELESIRVQLGIPEPLELPRAKASFRDDRRSYREIFGEAERSRIAELFSEEIQLLGYQF